MTLNPSRDDFAALLDEALGGRDFVEGQVVHGKVVGIEKDFAIVDVGLKTEGRVSLKEFSGADGKPTIKTGDTVEVYLERVENAMGEAVISREKARREEAWTRLEVVFADGQPVMGTISGRTAMGSARMRRQVSSPSMCGSERSHSTTLGPIFWSWVR